MILFKKTLTYNFQIFKPGNTAPLVHSIPFLMTAQLMRISAARPDHGEHQTDNLSWGTSPRNSLWAWTAYTDACKTSSITLPSNLSVSFGDWAKP